MAQNLQKYSLVLKKQIVDLYQTGHWSYSQLKCKYGVSKENVIKWSKQYSETNNDRKAIIIFSHARDIPNRKLNLQTGTSDSNSESKE